MLGIAFFLAHPSLRRENCWNHSGYNPNRLQRVVAVAVAALEVGSLPWELSLGLASVSRHCVLAEVSRDPGRLALDSHFSLGMRISIVLILGSSLICHYESLSSRTRRKVVQRRVEGIRVQTSTRGRHIYGTVRSGV